MTFSVLIVDDNVDLAENVREVLTSVLGDATAGSPHGGVDAVVASDAREGLALARARPFDVAIVDVRLPDASGIDLIAPLRAARPRCEIILLTGNATIESAISALRAGASGYVLKSFRPDELVATVEQALQKSALRRERELYERRYHALVNATDVLIVGLDADGQVAFFNPKLGELLGVDPTDAVGRSLVQTWIDPADARLFRKAMAEAKAGEPAKEVEAGMVDAEGAVRRVRWHLSLARDDLPDTPDHVYGIGVDVTARRALERRAASAEALNAMAPLALGLAHEIRNPLNAAVLELHLLGRAIDRLDDASVSEPMRRRVQIVDGEIRRLERLLTEFLELARPRAPQREQIDLAKVVADVLELEREAIEGRRVRVSCVAESACEVVGDVEKLKQVVLNLVVNALDVMPDGGTLEARVSRNETEVSFCLIDSGKGVDPKILAEVFDPFFTTKPAGTGLGLAIVRKIVEQHGGRVSLSSRHDDGTTATVTLPSAKP